MGQFHPAIVHLPVGILLFALFLMALPASDKNKNFDRAVALALLVGSITGFLACITGYILSESQAGYDKVLVTRHMWSGIALAVVSLMLYAKTVNPEFGIPKKLFAILLLLLIILTGYLGSMINPHFS